MLFKDTRQTQKNHLEPVMQTIGINTKKIRNKVSKVIKYAKERFYNNLELSISDFHKNDRKKNWQVIRHFVKNNNASNNIPPLSELSNGQTTYCFSDEEKLNVLIITFL